VRIIAKFIYREYDLKPITLIYFTSFSDLDFKGWWAWVAGGNKYPSNEVGIGFLLGNQ